MEAVETDFLHGQLEERKRRLETAIAQSPQNQDLTGLLHEVDSALDLFSTGTYGLCETCHDTVERDRLLADPLVRYCLDHLTRSERDDLQRDLDLASKLQRTLLPPVGLRVHGWDTSYHYAPVGPVSGDYCDLFTANGQLFFVLGDISGKGVAASMRMTQLHALFRSLSSLGLRLGQIVEQVNRFLCDSALAGQYATLVCGQANCAGELEIFNAGHTPVIVSRAGDDTRSEVARAGDVQRFESTGMPLGMFHGVAVSGVSLKLDAGDTLFLYTDGLSEARGADDEYGVDRVASLVYTQSAQSPGDLISACLADLRVFAAAVPPFDDLTLLAIRRVDGFDA